MLDKRPTDVLGSLMNCPNFLQCPFCYGCRNYEVGSPTCESCASNYKKNICNTEKHQAKIIAKMVKRTVIKL